MGRSLRTMPGFPPYRMPRARRAVTARVHGKEFRAPPDRVQVVPALGDQRCVSPARPRRAVLHPAAAAQRHRHAAHGACLPADDDGHPDPPAPHARLRHLVASRHRPCRHRHPEDRRESARRGRQDPSGPRPRGLRRPRVAMEGDLRLHHHPPDAPTGPGRRLVARALHHGSRPVRRGAQGVRRVVSRRADLSRQAAGQLGPGAQDGRVRSRSRQRGTRRFPVVDPLSGGRRRGEPRGGHHAPGDHARRRRGRRAPGGRTLRAPDRQNAEAAADRPADPGDRRCLRRSRVRHRRGEDHPRARFQRLCHRPAARARPDRHLHPGRAPERRRPAGLSRPGTLRGAQTHPRRPRSRGPFGRHAAAQTQGAGEPAFRCGGRADAHRPVVRRSDPGRAAGRASGRPPGDHPASAGRGARGPHPLRAGELGRHVHAMAGEHPGLVHQPAIVVGAPDPGLV